jgi:magnesium transporter
MKELSFNFGRLTFSPDTYQMVSCLPDTLEYRVKAFYLSKDGLIETGFSDFEHLGQQRDENDFLWLHLTGTLGEEFWRHLSEFLHLTDEQVKYMRGPHQKAFVEDFHNGMFWSLQRPSVTADAESIESVNFFMAKKVLVTRQFSHDQAFAYASHRLMEKGEHFSNIGVDSLAAFLIEDVIGSYFDLLQFGGTRLEEIQNKIILHPGKVELDLINRAQQIIWIFLNDIWPVETVLQAIQRSTNPLWTGAGKHQIEYRQDEAAAVIRLLETHRAMSYNLMDVYVSRLSLRTNETTTILTMIATLFLPPTLIAGIYGMNFFIPEVHATFGYYVCLASMVLISGSIFWWLKHRGYIDL